MYKLHRYTDRAGIFLRIIALIIFLVGISEGEVIPPVQEQAVDPGKAVEGAPEGLTQGEWASLRQQMAAAQYQFTWQEQQGEWAYRAPNPAQGFDLAFGLDGMRATRDESGEIAWNFGLALAAYGDARVQPLKREQLSARETRVEYRWDEAVTEWYENRPQGLEHGLTLSAPPGHGDVALSFELHGDLQPRLDDGGQGLRLVDKRGRATLRYDALRVADANGRELAARLEVGESAASPLRILIEAQGARYPITVDPLFYSQVDILRASDRQDGDFFGVSVNISGDKLVVGAYHEDGGSSSLADAGAAYVFTRNQGGADAWGQVKILHASDKQAGDNFGRSVAIYGDVIVVGAPKEDGGSSSLADAGAAYVFYRNQGGAENWGEVKILRASDQQPYDQFGTSVSISGDKIVVGAYGEDGGAGSTYNGAGAAYVFYRNQGGTDAWGEKAILHANDKGAGDSFGYSVDISFDTIVVGAYYEDGGPGDSLYDAGAAYVFVAKHGGADAWDQAAKIQASDRDVQDYFGIAVSIQADIVAVGAVGENGGLGDPADHAGAVYVYARNQNGAEKWGQVKILHASDFQANDEFGQSVSISGDTILVGAITEYGGPGNPVPGAGAAYIFARNQGGADLWGQVAILHASDMQNNDAFGVSAAMDKDTIVVGAYSEDGGSGDYHPNCGAAYTFVNWSGQWQEVSLRHASDMQAYDNFGQSVAIYGDTLVVGAYSEDGGSGDLYHNAGAAYLFTRNQGGADAWGQVKILRASDLQEGDKFGWSAAISGDTVVVGAYQEDGGAGDPGHNTGAAYVFYRNQGGADAWGEVKILHISDKDANDEFGTSVAIDGDIIAVGAPYEDGLVGDPYEDTGSVYIFYRHQGGADHWGQVWRESAGDKQENDLFGSSVSISGDVLVVGAPEEDGGVGDPQNDAGAAYVFYRNTFGTDLWGQVAILHASDMQANDEFGASVAISGDKIVVGAYHEDGGAGNPLANAGAAYVFIRNKVVSDDWGQAAILRASDQQAYDEFGSAVAISGDRIVVGAADEDGGAGNPLSKAGAGYVFMRNLGGMDAWGETAILRASDRQANDAFGYAVAVNGDVLVIGALNEEGGAGDPVNDAGAVYIFYSTPYQVMLPLVIH